MAFGVGLLQVRIMESLGKTGDINHVAHLSTEIAKSWQSLYKECYDNPVRFLTGIE